MDKLTEAKIEILEKKIDRVKKMSIENSGKNAENRFNSVKRDEIRGIIKQEIIGIILDFLQVILWISIGAFTISMLLELLLG